MMVLNEKTSALVGFVKIAGNQVFQLELLSASERLMKEQLGSVIGISSAVKAVGFLTLNKRVQKR
ncbi:hypothetical protein P5673_007937 [Acropora cervicornis]|uniref:Uncharacterized protein n=1 Tax=Acropora cervicornis TaxID=6130 RepID=A0AAD9QVB1_ACRCE|nr:hypothetical protein P5673_007937 [Acropora cervicornis]